MKTLRYGLYGLLVLVLLVVAGAAIFVATFDANRYKTQIQVLVLKHTGRVLTIDGEVNVTIYPQLGVTLTQASLSEPNFTQPTDTKPAPSTPFLTLKSTRLSMALLPLLKGDMLIDGIDIEGLNIHLVRHAKGTLNIQDLIDRAAPKQAATDQSTPRTPIKPTVGAKPLSIDIRAVTIKDSALTFIDEQSQQRWDLNHVAVSTERLAPNASGQLSASWQLQSSSASTDTTAELTGQYQLALSEQRVTLSKARANLRGHWQDMQAIDLKLAFDAQAQLDTGRYQLDSVNARATAQISAAQTATPANPAQAVTIKAQTAQLLFNAQEISGQAVNLSADLTQHARRLETQITLPPWRWHDQTVTLDHLALNLTLTDASISHSPLHVSLTGPFAINVKEPSIKSTLTGDFNASPFTLSGTITDFKQPTISFVAHLQTLDLTQFTTAATPPNTPLSSAAGSTPQSSPSNPAANAGALDFSGLHGHQIQGQVRIDTVRTRAAPITEVASAINLAKGRLTLGPHQASIWGGQIKGSLILDANTETVSLHETVSHVDIESLLKSLSATAALSGRGDLLAQVSATGNSRDALLKSLNGHVGLQLKDGAIKGVDLQAILRSARAALGRAPTQSAATDGQTRFTELTATASIKNGVADNQDLRVKAPLFRVQGSGTVDIAAGELNYLTQVAVVETSEGQGGADLQALRGLTVPVRLTGPLARPNYRVDVAALAAELAKSRLNDNVKDQINKAVPGLGDALKGLFGR